MVLGIGPKGPEVQGSGFKGLRVRGACFESRGICFSLQIEGHELRGVLYGNGA